MATEVFLLLLLSTLLIPSSPRPPTKKKQNKLSSVLLADQDSPVAAQPPSQKTSGGWRPWLDHPNQPLLAMPRPEPPSDRSWLLGTVRQISWAPLNLGTCCHINSGHRPTPLGAGGGHWEVNYLPQIEQEATGAALQ